jgi:hypothetical protein
LVGDAKELAQPDGFVFREARRGDDGSRIVHFPNKKDGLRAGQHAGRSWCKGLQTSWQFG